MFGSSASVGVAGQSQTGTATVRGRIQQLRSDQNALAAGIATQRGQLDTTRNQMQSDSQAYQTIVQAIMMTTACLYEHRGDAGGALSDAAMWLLDRYRLQFLGG